MKKYRVLCNQKLSVSDTLVHWGDKLPCDSHPTGRHHLLLLNDSAGKRGWMDGCVCVRVYMYE